WEGPSPEVARLGAAIAQGTGLPEIVGRVLASRGVEPHEAAAQLAPTLRELMPDPSRLAGMDVAAARLHRAVGKGERIAVFADYDVDGGASAALLLTWLRAQGRAATLYVPDRIEEGYGPNEPAMAALGAAHDLIVCVDCGTLSHGPIAAAGCDVIVLDHHLAGADLPPALAVVNPNRPDDASGLGHLCAAGVVFLTLVAVNRLIRAEGAAGPDLMPLVDLVALATVADVAPLVGLNRAFVRQGLAVMRGGLRPGIAALAEAAGLVAAPGVHSLGFVLGPRVNAGGRVGAADLGARLLATADPHEAAALAGRLDRLNGERRAIEAEVLARAMAQAEANGVDGSLVWAAGEGWHPGVVGIVAARLKEAFGRPALVVGFAGAAGKGSGRSIHGVDLGAAVARLAAEGLIERGGGHRMAAGVSLSRDQLAPAIERLAALLARKAAAPETGRPLLLTGLVPAGADLAFAEAIAGAGPYGAEAPAPRVAVADARLTGLKRLGGGHLALSATDGIGGRLEAVAFRVAESPLGPLLEASVGGRVHLAGRLEIDEWGGRRRVKLHVEDAARPA
ncbi:single-stranded-DNA-specific exonuclease RecJ, partial [Amaricoccus sp.]|uniref:single-stranded-DNA-specific exonuclease RecJ n=1 Tax=Amaricoccus sp. TaxID=1872485 RepID=UPI001B432E79